MVMNLNIFKCFGLIWYSIWILWKIILRDYVQYQRRIRQSEWQACKHGIPRDGEPARASHWPIWPIAGLWLVNQKKDETYPSYKLQFPEPSFINKVPNTDSTLPPRSSHWPIRGQGLGSLTNQRLTQSEKWAQDRGRTKCGQKLTQIPTLHSVWAEGEHHTLELESQAHITMCSFPLFMKYS